MVKTDKRIDAVKLDKIDAFIEQMDYIGDVTVSFELYSDGISINLPEYATEDMFINIKDGAVHVGLYDYDRYDIKQTIDVSGLKTADVLYDSDCKRVIITADNGSSELYISYIVDQDSDRAIALIKEYIEKYFIKA